MAIELEPLLDSMTCFEATAHYAALANLYALKQTYILFKDRQALDMNKAVLLAAKKSICRAFPKHEADYMLRKAEAQGIQAALEQLQVSAEHQKQNQETPA